MILSSVTAAPVRAGYRVAVVDHFFPGEQAFADEAALQSALLSFDAVDIDGERVAQIGTGLLVLIGVEPDDGPRQRDRLLERLISYRVFPDEAGRMKLSVRDIGGSVLLVPQFTLAADTKKGTRASFTRGAEPDRASAYFDDLVMALSRSLDTVATGRFGADMQVELVNDGPVTFWLET